MTVLVNSSNTQFFLTGATSIYVNGVTSNSPVTYANYLGETLIIRDTSNTLATIVVSSDGKFSIVLENNVLLQTIQAFINCTNLTSITIPSSVTSIGNQMFYGCTNLTSVTIPSSVTSIGNQMFRYCTNLTSFTIPSSVTSIGNAMFYGCTSLTTIEIPSSVTTIGNAMFQGCTSLTTITIPSSVTSIGNGMFDGCTSLTTITIPSSVTSIGNVMFNGCTSLTSVTIPSSVTSIGDYMFQGCTSLTSVTIPSSVTSIGNRMFNGCTSLTSVTIPSSVTFIGASAFANCVSLTNIIIPSSVTFIGGSVFFGCESLTSIIVPESVTTIDTYGMFYYCTSLTSVTIPSSVTSIGDGMFEECTSLTSVTIPSSVTSIGNRMFQGCTSLTSVTIPSSVTLIGNSMFRGCTSLTSVTIPSSVTSIGNSMFNGCTSLTSVTIPSSVTTIGDAMFQECTSLTSVTIPSSVQTIGYYAFEYSGIESILVDTSNNSFTSVDGVLYNKQITTLVCYPPRKPGDTFTIPSTVTTISPAGMSGCVSLKQILSDSSTFTSVDGVLYTADKTILLFYPSGKTDTSFTIPDTVITIQAECFVDCLFSEVTIPSSVKYIECWLFAKCNNIVSITIPSGAKLIPGPTYTSSTQNNVAFYDNANLNSIVFVGDYSESDSTSIQLFYDIVTTQKIYYLANNPTWNNITNYMGTPAEGITDSKYDVIWYYNNLIAYKSVLTNLLVTSNSKYSKAKNYMREYDAIAYLFYTAIEATKATSSGGATGGATGGADTAINPYLTSTEQQNVTSAIRDKYYQYYSSMYSKAKILAATFVIVIADTQSTIDKVSAKLGDTDVLNYLEERGINVNNIPQYTIEVPDIDALEAQSISKINSLNGLTVSKVVNSTKTAYTGVYNDFVSALDSMNFDTTTM